MLHTILRNKLALLAAAAVVMAVAVPSRAGHPYYRRGTSGVALSGSYSNGRVTIVIGGGHRGRRHYGHTYRRYPRYRAYRHYRRHYGAGYRYHHSPTYTPRRYRYYRRHHYYRPRHRRYSRRPYRRYYRCR
jgi:hypothetical protein